jgi:hypothetical protein
METTRLELEQKLHAIADKIRQMMQIQRPAKVPDQINMVILASFFVYNLNQGGFSQLLYNAGGQYLGEMEDILLTSDAKVTHGFYVQAIQRCISDVPLYQTFLNGDYMTENKLKNALHLLSIKYFECNTSFVEEAKVYIDETLTSAERWLSMNG